MSRRLISRSPDLQRLQEDGLHLEVVAGSFLLVRQVPYRTPSGQLGRGTLVTQLELANDITVKPEQHVAYFVADETPTEATGAPIKHMISDVRQQLAAGLEITHTYSSKPPPPGYADYHHKITHYVELFSGPARTTDPGATAFVFPLIADSEEESVFLYADTAASRAGIDVINDKLKPYKVGIVGLGGTGSYILDLIAKTPVREIHLYDGDRFIQHNAFRSPGAHRGEDVAEVPQKVAHFARLYSQLRRAIVEHDGYVTEANVDQLRELDFVFLTVDKGPARRLLVSKLEEFGTPFIDVGLGVYEVDGLLGGMVRTTTSTPEQRQHVHDRNRIPFSGGEANDYRFNIQIADLNALNAALAVIRWKKLAGFYLDQEHEHFSLYQIGGNNIINEDLP
jgi:hypothetical protein